MEQQTIQAIRKEGRTLRIALIATVVFVIASLVAVLAMVSLVYQEIHASDVSETVFISMLPPDPVTLCPGQELQIPITYQIKRAPIVLRPVEDWRRDNEPTETVVGHELIPHFFDRAGTFQHIIHTTVPPLAPGNYTYYRAWEESARWPSYISVGVTIPSTCKIEVPVTGGTNED